MGFHDERQPELLLFLLFRGAQVRRCQLAAASWPLRTIANLSDPAFAVKLVLVLLFDDQIQNRL